MQGTTSFRAGLVGIKDMYAPKEQPFNTMAPVPPHFSYKPVISTYMDHYGRKNHSLLRPPQPKEIISKNYPMDKKQETRYALADVQLWSEKAVPTYKNPPTEQPCHSVSCCCLHKLMLPPHLPSSGRTEVLKHANHKPRNTTDQEAVERYMAEVSQKNNYPGFSDYNARIGLPDRPAHPRLDQHLLIKRIEQCGGISAAEARQRADKDYSVDFWHPGAVAALAAAPTNTMNRKIKKHSYLAKPRRIPREDLHWMAWDSGTPEPPGLQKRLHRPWPSPEPPRDDPVTGNGVYRPRIAPRQTSRSGAQAPLHQHGNPLLYSTGPVPDAIGSEGTHPVLVSGTEEAFVPSVTAVPYYSRPAPQASHYQTWPSDQNNDCDIPPYPRSFNMGAFDNQCPASTLPWRRVDDDPPADYPPTSNAGSLGPCVNNHRNVPPFRTPHVLKSDQNTETRSQLNHSSVQQDGIHPANLNTLRYEDLSQSPNSQMVKVKCCNKPDCKGKWVPVEQAHGYRTPLKTDTPNHHPKKGSSPSPYGQMVKVKCCNKPDCEGKWVPVEEGRRYDILPKVDLRVRNLTLRTEQRGKCCSLYPVI